MRAVIQRVSSADVKVEGKIIGEIQEGILVLVGFLPEDNVKAFEYIAEKLINLRIFEDEAGKLNRSVLDIGGSLLLVPNFTLYADCRQGRRPSFSASSPAETARSQFETFCKILSRKFPRVETGEFQADMKVSLTNEGPVTLILES
ncbi:MAG TPA: D-tyrosyl-tRNA(Tyr) deacylase [Peptococcaceae bacterium]|nr:D-tyrosyl-tRNA(Tyr) deacylase [Peptococcaceae bacterium]